MVCSGMGGVNTVPTITQAILVSRSSVSAHAVRGNDDVTHVICIRSILCCGMYSSSADIHLSKATLPELLLHYVYWRAPNLTLHRVKSNTQSESDVQIDINEPHSIKRSLSMQCLHNCHLVIQSDKLSNLTLKPLDLANLVVRALDLHRRR